MTLGTDLIVGSAPPAKGGSAASISEAANQLSIALGIAILRSIGALVYRPVTIALDPLDAREGTELPAGSGN